MRHLLGSVVVAVAAGVGGCSSSSAGVECLSSGEAEVCAEGTSGASFEIRASGLEPGSELVLELDPDSGPQSYEVGEDGAPVGAIGMVSSGTGDTPTPVQVRAVAAGGSMLEGELEPSLRE